MENLVEYIVKQLVNEPEAVAIVSEVDGDVTIIRVSVAEGDLGRVIGKGGKVANSIRAIVRSASSKEGKRYAVKIGDKE